MQQISDKNQEIENLQRSLEEKKQKANLLAKQHQSILETSDLTVQKIQQNVDEVSTQLKKLIRENRQSEKALQEVQLCLTLHKHCVILYKSQHPYFPLIPLTLSVFYTLHRKTVSWRQTLKSCSKTLMMKSKKSR